MTERAKIERLLQKTGRTLDGLPEFYPEEQAQTLYFEVAEKRELWENIVLHQSDVIELLVGALQDSLKVRDTAVSDLKLISHCATCSNHMPDESGICVHSGGGGSPFMACPGYIWDKS